jgi:hypothetical protein
MSLGWGANECNCLVCQEPKIKADGTHDQGRWEESCGVDALRGMQVWLQYSCR